MNRSLEKIKNLVEEKFKVKTIGKDNTEHLLIHGDCEYVMAEIPNNSIDIIITDPPYNQNIDYGKKFNDRKKKENFYDWLKNKLKNIKRILKPTGSFYLISYPEINARILPYLEDELKMNYRRWITWHYPTNIGHSKKNFTRSQRTILFFTKTKDKYIFNREKLIQHYKNPTAPVIRKRTARGYKGRTSYDLLRFLDLLEMQPGMIDTLDFHLLKNNSKDRFRNLNSKFKPLSKEELKKLDHPCQLPLGLLELLIKVSSNKGDVVLDPFAGTYTTSVAAKKLKRNSIGIEVNNKYINFGLRRIRQ